jgi:hypothetical protein
MRILGLLTCLLLGCSGSIVQTTSPPADAAAEHHPATKGNPPETLQGLGKQCPPAGCAFPYCGDEAGLPWPLQCVGGTECSDVNGYNFCGLCTLDCNDAENEGRCKSAGWVCVHATDVGLDGGDSVCAPP